jgi:hypothetical protein
MKSIALALAMTFVTQAQAATVKDFMGRYEAVVTCNLHDRSYLHLEIGSSKLEKNALHLQLNGKNKTYETVSLGEGERKDALAPYDDQTVSFTTAIIEDTLLSTEEVRRIGEPEESIKKDTLQLEILPGSRLRLTTKKSWQGDFETCDFMKKQEKRTIAKAMKPSKKKGQKHARRAIPKSPNKGRKVAGL